MSLSNGDHNGNAPWYVNAAYKLGVPTIIAGFLVWFLAARVTKGMEDLGAALSAHANATMKQIEVMNDLKELQQQEGHKFDTLINILRVDCVQSAIEAGTSRQNCYK